MDAENVKTDEQLRAEWIDRPQHLKHLSFAEWKEERVRPAKVAVVAEMATASARPRHEPGKMNGLEKRYAAHLDTRKTVGEIADWKFEPLKLKLAPATGYNPDFGVQMADGRIELHETKGHQEDDARVKIKWAAKDFGTWFRIVQVREITRGKSDWKFEEFHA